MYGIFKRDELSLKSERKKKKKNLLRRGPGGGVGGFYSHLDGDTQGKKERRNRGKEGDVNCVSKAWQMHPNLVI